MSENEILRFLIKEVKRVLDIYTTLQKESKYNDLSDVHEKVVFSLITQAKTLANSLPNREYYDSINKIIDNYKDRIYRQFNAVFGILDGMHQDLVNGIINLDLEVDHIFPYALGGSNEEYNLMALCKNCNQNKNVTIKYYMNNEGKYKLMENIRIFVKSLPLIHDFNNWLKKIGDMRRRKNN